MITPRTLDTTPVTPAITRLIATGTTEQALLAVVQLFPDLSPVELSVALQDATAAAEARREEALAERSGPHRAQLWHFTFAPANSGPGCAPEGGVAPQA
jgi:hypothetical protein